MRHRPTISISSVLAAALALPAFASAHHPPPTAAELPAPKPLLPKAAKAMGKHAVPLPGGRYKIEVKGPDLITHGPDSKPGLGTRARAATSSGGVGFAPGDPERAPVCATDYYQHVLYGRTASAPDRLAEVKPEIQAAMRRMNAVLNADSIASGGGTADYKVLCDAPGQIRVDGFVSSGTGYSAIVNSARDAGFNASNADYTIFFDATTSYCGVGSYAEDESPLESNASNAGGGYAVAYRDCWYNETPMHENGHNQGAVQYNAPNSTGVGGHCYDEADVLCYSPDGGDLNQGGTVLRCGERIHFDCGYDDYFDTSPEVGEYLSTHWNIGSPFNRFIAFGLPGSGGDGDDGGGEDTTPPPPGSSPVVLLRNRVRTIGQTAAAGEWRWFRTQAPRRLRVLRVTVRAARSMDVNVYMRRGRKPTLRRYACRSATRGSRERCVVQRPRKGRWLIGVYTLDGTEGARLAIRAVKQK